MSSDAWSEGSIDANGVSLHYYRTGGDKPPMIMLHGINDNGLCWTPVAKELEHYFDIIMLDERGHGKSIAPEMDFGLELMADDVAALIKELDLHEPVLLGHSMGGQVATITAGKYPALVSKIMLEDPAYFLNKALKALVKLAIPLFLRNARHNDKKTIDQIKTSCKKDHPSWSDDEIAPWAVAQKEFSQNAKTVKIGKIDLDIDWYDVFSKITCPMLLIIPSNGVLRLKAAEKLKPSFGSTMVKIAYIPGAGHSVRREQFEKFMDAVKSFCIG
ncbi:MAG TPA: alpha/beta hydrolase [Candidatus Lokiarchaeia archaeon]|nr:alpha/beta hydrolase [Candidatus Lokiarchaeia archaeon]